VALKFANQKFISRYQYIEDKLKEQGKAPEQATLDEMEELYQQAKRERIL